MICYVFDLDDTLMQTSRLSHEFDNMQRNIIRSGINPEIHGNLVQNYYDHIVPSEPHLYHLLSNLKGPKIILTNSSGNHAKYSLQAMRLNNHFYKIVNANSLNFIVKPHVNAYLNAEKSVRSISPLSSWNFIFFDDLVENLNAAKKMGWVTVLVNKDYPHYSKEKLKQVDYAFHDIYQALFYFVSIQNRTSVPVQYK
jgi:HAD superfamily hydrolase (TIGR01509 family)